MPGADCLFCKILKREVPGEIVYEDDEVMAFKDLYPLAPVHLLIIPKVHLCNLNELTPESELLMGRIFRVIRRLAEEFGVAESGYRVVTNTGADGGQVIGHLHFHLLGGQALGSKIG